MSKLIMMRGLPASGKTTKAKEIVDNGGDFVRVNKDLLRTMLHFDRFTGRNEGITNQAQAQLVRYFIEAGKNVVVDDTNMGEKHAERWETIANELGAKFEIIRMDASVEDCIERDCKRMEAGERGVGAAVITNMALQYNMLGIEHPIVVCDIDGTVADCEHRKHYIEGEKKDWGSFFANMMLDTPRTDVIEQVRSLLDEKTKLVFVSARPENYRTYTEEWLREKTDLPYTALIMRHAGDKRPDTEVKDQIYRTYLQHYSIKTIFDDRPSVIRMWREHGLDVIDVGNGVEF